MHKVFPNRDSGCPPGADPRHTLISGLVRLVSTGEFKIDRFLSFGFNHKWMG